MTRHPRLMILGAGPWQLPLIRKAASSGAWVITVDNVPGNLGHTHAHQSVNCDTRNGAGVLAYARELHIDGIATMASDVALPTLSLVAERLGLPGCPSGVARRMINKAEFRAFQHATGGLSTPPFICGHDFTSVYAQLRAHLSAPLVFKAVRSSGSRGVSFVDTLSEDRCRQSFLAAQGFSPDGMVCVEAFVPGEDVSGDGFMSGGHLAAVVTRKYSTQLVPIGHRVPTHLDDAAVGRIIQEVERTCLALEYLDGPIDFDVRVTPSQTTVLEMTARLGGNGIPLLIERACGLDLVALTIAHALGERVRIDRVPPASRAAGSHVFGSAREGVLRAVTSIDDLRVAVPEVFAYQLHRQRGERVSRFEHSGNAVGHVLFDCQPPAGYDSVVDRIVSALHVEVEPSSSALAGTAGSATTGARS